MREAFVVLERAKREAEARLKKAEADKQPAAYCGAIRQAVRELDKGLAALKYMDAEWLKLNKLWSLVVEGNRHVQALHSNSTGRKRADKTSSNRRRR